MAEAWGFKTDGNELDQTGPVLEGTPPLRPAATTAVAVVGEAHGVPGEPCPRCGAEMAWRHQSFQCPACRYKEGCCS